VAKRLLIATGDSASSPVELPFGVRELIDAADEILVVAPALPTRFEWLSSATDKAREQADERLRTVLDQLANLEPDQRWGPVDRLSDVELLQSVCEY
jgi:hypothetical protein